MRCAGQSGGKERAVDALGRWAQMLALGAVGYAAVVALAWWFQRKLIYLPRGRVPPVGQVLPGASEEVLETADGLRLGGWFVPARTPAPRATVIVCNGNAGNRTDRAPLARALAERGFSTLLFDYRGYGGNPGAPTEQGLLADALAARAHLDARPGVDPDRIVYFGESLGAAVAVAAARERVPAALVLRSPFTSLVAVGRVHYFFLPVNRLLKDRYPALEQVRELLCPLLVIAGDRDEIVPPAESRQLWEAAGGRLKRFVLLRGGHNDPELLAGSALIQAVEGFWAEVLSERGPRKGLEVFPRER
ncbi:MAG: alpha/beta hydrolase [Deferrisomatales bacterium]